MVGDFHEKADTVNNLFGRSHPISYGLLIQSKVPPPRDTRGKPAIFHATESAVAGGRQPFPKCSTRRWMINRDRSLSRKVRKGDQSHPVPEMYKRRWVINASFPEMFGEGDRRSIVFLEQLHRERIVVFFGKGLSLLTRTYFSGTDSLVAYMCTFRESATRPYVLLGNGTHMLL
jgi:hypothetical protein